MFWKDKKLLIEYNDLLKEKNSLLNENNLLKEESLKLVKQLAESKRPFYWVLDRVSEEETDILKSNKKILKILKKELLVRFVTRLDYIRDLSWRHSLDYKVWFLDSLNELTVYLDWLLAEELTEEEKNWQNLK